MQKDPYVIVLILSYNGKGLLDDSISSYLENDYNNFEVIVIDNGSTDGTKPYVYNKWATVEVLRTEKNLGYSGGFNMGLEHAFKIKKADYVLITNNDVKVDDKVISSLVETALMEAKVGFVTGKVYFYDNPNMLQTVGKKHHELYWSDGHIGGKEYDNGQYDKVEQREWCDDIYWLVSAELYQTTGGYDTLFQFQSEDYDWQVRAKQNGYKIFYTPHAKIWHKDSITIGKVSPFKAYYDARNPLIVHFKHRTYKEYNYFYKKFRKSICKCVLRNLLKLKFYYSYKCLRGFFSAITWGLRNNKITLAQFLK